MGMGKHYAGGGDLAALSYLKKVRLDDELVKVHVLFGLKGLGMLIAELANSAGCGGQ